MILFSPSQIKTYRECVRKWALTKIVGLRTPSTKSQELGKDVDDNQLQPYLRDGRPFDYSREVGGVKSADIAASGMAHLPQPQWRGLEVQKHFVFESPSKLGFGYQGYLDVWLPFGGVPGIEGETPTVMDFKTTKSIRKWALNEEALRADPQSQIYAVWGILETKTKEIWLDWLYLQTEGSKLAVPTKVKVHTDEVAEQFQALEKTTREMFPLMKAAPSASDATQAYALSLPANPLACDNYGGCPFRHLCNLSPEDFFGSIDKPVRTAAEPGVQVMPEIDLFSKLKKKAQPEVATEATVATPTPDTTATQVTTEPETLGINPPMPEGSPEAPPVGVTEAKPKRGRPKKEVAVVSETPMVDAAVEEVPQTELVAYLEFAIALGKLIKAVK